MLFTNYNIWHDAKVSLKSYKILILSCFGFLAIPEVKIFQYLYLRILRSTNVSCARESSESSKFFAFLSDNQIVASSHSDNESDFLCLLTEVFSLVASTVSAYHRPPILHVYRTLISPLLQNTERRTLPLARTRSISGATIESSRVARDGRREARKTLLWSPESRVGRPYKDKGYSTHPLALACSFSLLFRFSFCSFLFFLFIFSDQVTQKFKREHDNTGRKV